MPACGYRCRVKRNNGGSIRCCKAEVQTRLFVGWNRALGLENPERDAVAPIPVTQQRFRSPEALVSERLQYGVVETLAWDEIPYPDRNVSNHGPSQRMLRGLIRPPWRIGYSVSVSLSVVPTGAEIQTKASARTCIVGTIRSG